MKRVKLLWVAMLTLILPALQSCDDGDGYSLGDIARDWATVRVVGGDTYALNADHWGSLWPAATAIPGYRPIDGQRVITYFNPLYDNYEGYDHGVKVECNYDVLTKQKYRFSLVRDMRNMAKDGDDGYIHLEYRYNTYGDVTKRCLNGAVSFNLNSLDLTGKKGIKVKLNSVENGEVEVVFDVKEQPIPEGAKNIELSNEVQVM